MKYGYGPDAPSICADEYEFHCSTPDCAEHSHEQEDFLKCESCAGLVCREHAVTPVDRRESYCAEHGKCECGERAYFACDECGKLWCHDHVLFVTHRDDPDFIDDETVIEYFCGPACQRASEWRAERTRQINQYGMPLGELQEAHIDAHAERMYEEIFGEKPEVLMNEAVRKPAGHAGLWDSLSQEKYF